MLIKIAIIGMGVMGRNHYKVIQQIKNIEIVAICDPLVEDIFTHKLYKSVDEMLNEVKIDAVIIAVPTSLHKEIAIKCMNKDITNLFIEKPIAFNVKEAQTILELSREKNIKIVVGHVERFNPVVQALKKEIKNKEVYIINIIRVSPFPHRISDVGILTDLSVHDIDLLRFISEKEIKNTHIFKSKKLHKHYEDNAILSFNMEEDITASINTNWLTPFRKRKIEVVCKDFYYEADLISQKLLEYSKKDNSFITKVCYVQKIEPLFNELTNFINYIKGEETIFARIEDSIKTLEIIKGE